jgi:hypothetical protein
MAKLTNKAKATLASILEKAKTAREFLSRADVAVARKSKIPTTTLHYTRPDGWSLYEIDKEIGSDLAQLTTAIRDLEAFLETN